MTEENTLANNSITQFILRIDLNESEDPKFKDIIEKIGSSYDRTEKINKKKISLKITKGIMSDLDEEEKLEYCLVKDSDNLKLIFSPIQPSITLSAQKYKDKSTYKSPMEELIEAYKAVFPDIKSKRIGMRYINEFKCSNLKGISKIFNSEVSKTIKIMATKENVSRVISQEEYNYDTSNLRTQYGILNKFYPAKLNNYDLVLDIDSSCITQQAIGSWNEIIQDLNHKAYEEFKRKMNIKYLEHLK